jgi:hypothetical protein
MQRQADQIDRLTDELERLHSVIDRYTGSNNG